MFIHSFQLGCDTTCLIMSISFQPRGKIFSGTLSLIIRSAHHEPTPVSAARLQFKPLIEILTVNDLPTKGK